MNESPISGETVVLPEPPPGWHDLVYSVTLGGELALVRCDRDYFAELRAWDQHTRAWDVKRLERGEIPPLSPSLSGARLRLSRFDGRAEYDAIEVPSDSFPKVASLPDGGWLVASGAPSRIYTRGGEPAGSLDVGAYMEHVCCAPSGRIRVGYFDQGVFARPDADGTFPVSTSGIAAFGPDGSPMWQFNGRTELFIADCYSLTIDGERVWSCPYALDPFNFAIVRIDDGQVRLWRNEVAGAKAIAAEGDYVLLAGGYDRDANRIALLRLETEDAAPVGEWRFEPPKTHSAGLIQGLGSTLHLVRGGKWSKLSVQLLLEAARSRKG